MAVKTSGEMFARAVAVALVGEHRAHALMGGGVIGIGLQRRLVMRARFRMAVGAEQEVAEVYVRHRVFRMVQDRFGIDAAGGVDGALAGEQRAEFVERAEIGRVPAQDIDEGGLRVCLAIESAEQRRPLDFGRASRRLLARRGRHQCRHARAARRRQLPLDRQQRRGAAREPRAH